jgi:hypothetical protein
MQLTKKIRAIFAICTLTLFSLDSSMPEPAIDKKPITEHSNTAEYLIRDALIQFANQNMAAGLDCLDRAWIQQFDSNWDETGFLILFCKAIGYDRLGMRGTAKNIVHFLRHDLDNKFQNCPPQESNITDAEYQEAFFFMSGLTSLASSREIQAELQSLVIELAFDQSTAVLPAIFLLGQQNWRLAQPDQQAAEYQFCSTSKFVKRWRHIFCKVRQILGLIKEAKDLVDDIKSTVN